MKLLLLLIAFIFNTNVAHAQSFTSADQNQDISGDWVFQKVVDYDDPNMKLNEVQEPRFVISGNKIIDSLGCQMPIQKEIYPHFDPFQLMMKGDATKESITSFFAKNFNEKMDLKKSPWGYRVNTNLKKSCNEFLSAKILVFSTQIIIDYGNAFFSYKKPAMNNAAINTYGRKITLLPFDYKKYDDWCYKIRQKNGDVRGTQIPSNNCTAFYHTYSLGKSDTDPLGSLLGSYNYIFNLGTEFPLPLDYDNPVKHGLRPVVLFFTPLKNVLVALVDDRETHNEQHRGANYREALLVPMFVTILNNKVIQTLAVKGQFSIDRNHQITVIDRGWFNDRTKDRIYKIQENGTIKQIQ
ncbi:hypothetical protein [Undibacterium sp. RuRC25W]|uniref:hypothetical protein n=1 Tax=Undibacterium sp. RuRC25W TaxID=3413047 RepID=UPI003BF2EC87